MERAGRSTHLERRHVGEDDIENVLRANGAEAIANRCLDRGDILAPGEAGGRRVDCAKIRGGNGPLIRVIVSHIGGGGVACVVHDQHSLVQRKLGAKDRGKGQKDCENCDEAARSNHGHGNNPYRPGRSLMTKMLTRFGAR